MTIVIILSLQWITLPSGPRHPQFFLLPSDWHFCCPEFVSNQPRGALKYTMWRHFSCVASWLFHIAWCSFTREKLTMVFVCHRTFSRAAVYQLKIWSGQIRSGFFFRRTTASELSPWRSTCCQWTSCSKKSHDATQKKCPHLVHFNVPCNWFEPNL